MSRIARLSPAETPLLKRKRARSGPYGVLDIGSSKVVCLIGRVESDGRPRVLGYGWQRSRGVKGGNIVDLQEAEHSIRAAVAQAEEMADLKLSGAIVNLSCGQPSSRVMNLQWPIGGRAVTEADLRAVLGEGRRRSQEEGRETVHAATLGFTIDSTPGVEDPRGMMCEMLGVKLHLVDAASAALRNLGLCLAGCDLEVEELVSAPFAAALSVLVEDEKQLGATVIDMGGGTTGIAVYGDGHLLHTAQLPVGGWQVTNDLARGLTTPLGHAERMKTLHGSCMEGGNDQKEMLSVPQVGEDDDHLVQVSRATMVGIIRPRLEETLELVRDRLESALVGSESGARVVLTGGASQLVGVRDLAARILDKPVRIGRPQPVQGLPDSALGPDFATTLGLLHWGAGEGRPLLDLDPGPERGNGRFIRFVNWLRDRV
ncbi:cell division protein FtsA [Pseudoroseomonas ludipueritiae]|uniref:Cell division protein FtsA n=1 Tax=Pseudoroseomonas ludipueritiae TaxID=198093 RepID=A0ABR7REE4_9PROT|nr:cell division protein FtsA [Pseudoroseomonas ludipueritiae]MBC9180249.1 cell division protein FtsA [Pseudoroseomonas ludipueritiae]MCG7361583.1 cell division protein FtsA [Roseomonas sp. ACRSG]